jgi:hypothetical protein
MFQNDILRQENNLNLALPWVGSVAFALFGKVMEEQYGQKYDKEKEEK